LKIKARNSISKLLSFVSLQVFLISLFILTSCQKNKEKAVIDIGFYYWKTSYSIQNQELAKLKSLQNKHLYLRYFDIALENYKAKPVAEIQFSSQAPKIAIPTIFIKNEVFYKTKNAKEIEELANNVLNKIVSISQKHHIEFEEIQIDCDWTLGTQKPYFHFLSLLKKQNLPRKLSCTIRLHQVKFYKKTGIPPVDRGTLMVYNVGDWKDINTKNSLFNQDIIEQYTNNFNTYPLNLDLAFPIFSQCILYRNKAYLGFMKDVQLQEILNTGVLAETDQKNVFISATDINFKNFRIRKGDVVRYEEVNKKEFEIVLKWMIQHNRTRNFNVLFFDIDPINLAKISHEKLSSIIAQN
jgi:hypothetical protein